MNVLLLIVSFAVLSWSAHRLVDGAIGLSVRLNISTLVIGLILISFCTSAPELVVSVIAALDGYTNLGVANVFGSNIANIALVLGVTALIAPLAVEKVTLTRDLPLLLVATILLSLMVHNYYLSRHDSLLLLLGFVVFLHIVFTHESRARKNRAPEPHVEINEDHTAASTLTLHQALLRFTLGTVLLLVSARVIVYAGIALAEQLGVSEVIIGLTVLAIGTSLPELASSIISATRKHASLAVGTIIGSNIFNSLLVTGTVGMVNPAPIEKALFSRDFVVMASVTLLLFVCCLLYYRKMQLPRAVGILFCIIYVAYITYLGFSL